MYKICTFIYIVILLSIFSCSSSTAGRDADSSVDVEPDTAALYPDSLTFAFAGDILMGTTFPEGPGSPYLPEKDGATMFDDVKQLFLSADLAAANLEGAMIYKGTPKNCGTSKLCFTFRIPPRYAEHLADAGIDFMSLANNHSFDFLHAGQDSTHYYLEKAGIKSAGIRHKFETSIFERHGLKIGFTAFGHGDYTLSNLDYEEVKSVVSRLAKDVDIVVVSMHGGGEGGAYSHVPHAEEMFHKWPRGNVEKFARTAIDAGADIVYGHGPHVVRGADIYKNRIIFYSLGNFCTPVRMGIAGIGGYAPVATVTINRDGSFRNGKIHGFIQQKLKGPRADNSGQVIRHIKDLSTTDFPNSQLVISDDGSLSSKK